MSADRYCFINDKSGKQLAYTLAYGMAALLLEDEQSGLRQLKDVPSSIVNSRSGKLDEFLDNVLKHQLMDKVFKNNHNESWFRYNHVQDGLELLTELNKYKGIGASITYTVSY
jgi:hypothetical protein